jgi:cytochrome d ubiquinol oxidase subunit I
MRSNGRLWRSDGFLRLCTWFAPLGFVAVICGWVVTEVGRQPWTVYGLMRTADSVSPSLTGHDVAISLALYVIVYLVMFPTGVAFMAGLVRRGPAETEEPASFIESGRPGQPFERASRLGGE